jgi:hypothetical protein
MPATIPAIYSALATRLDTISGLTVYDYQPDTILATPMAFPSLNTIEYHRAMGGGLQTYSFTVTIIVGRMDDKTAQTALHNYASWDGATSVRATLESDKTLGGVVETLVVQSSANVNSMSNGDNQFLTVDITLTVYG